MIDFNFFELFQPLATMLIKLWPLWIFVAISIFLKYFLDWFYIKIKERRVGKKFREGEKWRSDQELLAWLKDMKPLEFEKYIADLFSRLGYKARAVGGSHDGGVDVVIEKNNIRSYIQCKKYITSKVSVRELRDFYGSLADHLAEGKGYFITTNTFTLEAEKFAEDKPIELIDGYKLIRYIKMSEKKN